MGFTPAQVDTMSLWEFAACSEGYRRANSSEPELPAPPTAAEFEKMKANYATRYH